MNQNNDLPEGFKMTELGPLPKEWDVVRLGDVAENFDKKRIPLSNDVRAKKQGRYPYCGANGIIDYINSYIFDGEFLLLAEDGGFFKKFENSAYIMKGKFWVNNHVHILLAKEKVTTNNFLLYWLIYEDISKYVSGTTRQKLTQNVMNKILIPLPPLPEQKKIATVLSSVQEAREKTEAVIRALKELKKSMMKHLFTYGPVPPIEADRVPLKETEIGMVPEGWEVVRLGKVAHIKQGRTPKREDYTDTEGFRIIKVKDFEDAQKVSLRPNGERSFVKSEISGLVRAQALDTLILNAGHSSSVVGQKVGIVPSELTGMFYVGELTAIRANKELTDPYFLFGLFILPSIREVIRGLVKGGHLYANQLETLQIPFPPLLEQKKIAAVLSAIDDKIQAEENKKKSLDDLFKTLLNDLMTAKIRVNHLNLGVE